MMEWVIGGKKVSKNSPALIIAEAGINHDGMLDRAFDLIDMAAQAGADIVKFQLFTAERMYPVSAGLFKTADGNDTEMFSLIKDMELPVEWIPQLINRCRERNVGFLCTTCDEISTDILNEYGVDSFKIASSELTHFPLLKYTAKTGKTIIISEGAANLAEVARAIDEIKSSNNNNIVLMHCTAEYPAKLCDCNVNVIETYKKAFPDVLIGFSDHTPEPSDAPIQAILKGAKIIEKHITLDRTLPGADHSFALEYEHLKKLVEDVRYAETHMDEIENNDIIGGCTEKKVLEDEIVERNFIHRGMFSSKAISKGEVLTLENTVVLRPGNNENGVAAEFYDMLLSKKVKVNKNIAFNCPIRWDDILNI